MFDDFFLRALAGGIGVALVAGPLGCFVVWRRMAYFGDTMAHAALLGVALGVFLSLAPTVGVLAITMLVAALLLLFERFNRTPQDALLGILAHAALSLGVVAIGALYWVRIDLVSYLFGDVLVISGADVITIWVGGVVILAALAFLWRPLFAATVAEDIARAEGLHVDLSRIAFMLMIAFTIALAMKIVGVLLITALLIIPAAAARRFASSPESMAIIAALIGALSVVGGLFLSLGLDTQSGPSIVMTAFVLFLIAQMPLWRVRS